MHIAFAVVFFVFVGLSQTLEYGIFGLTPSETKGIITGTLLFSALIFLRSDIVSILLRPRHDLYGDPRFNWTWPRTIIGLALGPVLWIIPLAYGLTLIRINILPAAPETLINALAVQVFAVALAQELFFREAAIKACRANTGAIYVISVLAFFVYSMPQGVPAAMVAAGAGAYFLTLRLIGANIVAVALVHGATNVVFSDIVPLGLTGRDEWVFAAIFLGSAAVLSLLLYQLLGRRRSAFAYA